MTLLLPLTSASCHLEQESPGCQKMEKGEELATPLSTNSNSETDITRNYEEC